MRRRSTKISNSGLGSGLDLDDVVAGAKRFVARQQVGGLGALPVDIISKWNAQLARNASGPLGVMANILFLKGAQRTELTKRPLNFFLNFYSPIINLLKTCVDRVTQHTGKTQRKVHPLSNMKMDMRTSQSQDAQYRKNNRETFDFYFVFRTITQFMAICVTAPHILADEVVKMGLGHKVGSGDWGDLGVVDGGVVTVPAATGGTAGTGTTVAAAATPVVLEGFLAMLLEIGKVLAIAGGVVAAGAAVADPLLKMGKDAGIIPGQEGGDSSDSSAALAQQQAIIEKAAQEAALTAKKQQNLMLVGGGALGLLVIGILIARK